ncbi:HD-GYP domain-containing protein [Paenibacillus lutimineralis]|uniref:HD-GYP domain-containing protein n=1 Tax=Paenibacillus lutimineralis TaxID=2707005 RepID=UPI001D05336F|nr:HD domain-containing phosphohydrolase [Paenibacillus lutimineralis]
MVVSADLIEQLYIDKHSDMASWIKLLLYKHPEIYHHSVRVAMLAEKIAKPLELSIEDKGQLIRGCFLHDIGKSMIPREVVLRKESLSKNQLEIIKLYPIIGAEMIESNPGFGSDIIHIVKYHQERWDGGGYPEGLNGEEIPYAARICAVIDTFDLMMSSRKGNRKYKVGDAKRELLKLRGTEFDPEIVDALNKLPDQVLNILSLD